MENKFEYQILFVENINANDDYYKVTALFSSEDNLVKAGEIILSLETSKAEFDITAPKEGYLYYLNVKVGDNVRSSQKFAVIVNMPILKGSEIYNKIFDSNITPTPDFERDKFTKKAYELILENQLDCSEFSSYDKVTSKDVTDFLSKKTEQIRVSSLFESQLNHETSSNNIFLLGGLGTARMLIDLLNSLNTFSISGIIDPGLKKGSEIDGVQVLGGEEVILEMIKNQPLNIALSFTSLSDLNKRMLKYIELKKLGVQFPVLIHPDAIVERSVKLGEGSIVLAGSIIGSHANLGPLNFVNTGSIVSHEVTASCNNHFAPNSTIAGKVSIGANNLFGMNCSVFMGLKIGNNNIVQNGVSLFNSLGNNTRLSSTTIKNINS